ncbi:MAG TPA: DUF2007 domain-containing protein [Symbiobacteriaceae bacterium]|jgi:hypothetical protein|nr:DUF2007 domain-containing protein [Symbiobacteriaceae bacterium]
MEENTSSWVEVYNTGDDLQMEFVRGLLTTSGIPVVVQAKGAKALPVILGVTANGSYILKVPPELEDVARDLLNAEPQFPEDEAE